MAPNSFVVNAAEADRLAAEIQAKTEQLKSVIDLEVTKAGKLARDTAQAAAPRGPYTKRIRASIRTKTRRWSLGSEVAVESADPLGAILEFGTATSPPLGFMKKGLDAAVPPLEAALMDAVSRIVDGD